MKLPWILTFLLTIVIHLDPLQAQEEHITVQNPWARANPPVVENGAAYMTLINNGQQTDRLVNVSGRVAERIELHTHLKEDGMMKMRRLQAIEMVPGSSTVLEPGGLHMMLIGLQSPLKPGQSFPLTLHFEQAGEMNVEVTVRGIQETINHNGMEHGSRPHP